jgi:hypothetical protein
MRSHSEPSDTMKTRRANQRTALILASIAAVFFGGIIASQLGGVAGGGAVGIGVLGFGIIGFLLVTLGRRARR